MTDSVSGLPSTRESFCEATSTAVITVIELAQCVSSSTNRKHLILTAKAGKSVVHCSISRRWWRVSWNQVQQLCHGNPISVSQCHRFWGACPMVLLMCSLLGEGWRRQGLQGTSKSSKSLRKTSANLWGPIPLLIRCSRHLRCNLRATTSRCSNSSSRARPGSWWPSSNSACQRRTRSSPRFKKKTSLRSQNARFFLNLYIYKHQYIHIIEAAEAFGATPRPSQAWAHRVSCRRCPQQHPCTAPASENQEILWHDFSRENLQETIGLSVKNDGFLQKGPWNQ